MWGVKETLILMAIGALGAVTLKLKGVAPEATFEIHVQKGAVCV